MLAVLQPAEINGERAGYTAVSFEGPAGANAEVADVDQAAASTFQQAGRDAALG
jgi:hypothetical protein